MTTTEILNAAANHIEQTDNRAVVYALYKVTNHAIVHEGNRIDAENRIRRKVGDNIPRWAMNAPSTKEIADTLRSIAKETQ